METKPSPPAAFAAPGRSCCGMRYGGGVRAARRVTAAAS
ncbi:hypothetical protein BURMUCF2_B0010 [Burkholderia multivorans CF2]|nr:hypothetical protein BURMUCF2_B0010 [Burkholderia multivorans CF2]